MQLLELMQRRRSVRRYEAEPVPEEKLTAVLQAGLLAPSSGGLRPWRLIVVRDRQSLDRLGESRKGSIVMLKQATAAVVVVGAPETSENWVEDCAAVMTQMHLMAEEQGLGSCWLQGRGKDGRDGKTLDDLFREILGYPEDMTLAAVLSLGVPANHPPRRELEGLPEDHICWECFSSETEKTP